MIVAIDALDAWWPPTLRPSRLGRMWLALWIIHDDSQSTLRSSARSTRSRAARSSRALGVSGVPGFNDVAMPHLPGASVLPRGTKNLANLPSRCQKFGRFFGYPALI